MEILDAGPDFGRGISQTDPFHHEGTFGWFGFGGPTDWCSAKKVFESYPSTFVTLGKFDVDSVMKLANHQIGGVEPGFHPEAENRQAGRPNIEDNRSILIDHNLFG